MKEWWEPGKDIVIRIDDQTAEDRTEETLKVMIDEVKDIVNKYNFDLCCYSNVDGARERLVAEHELMLKYKDF